MEEESKVMAKWQTVVPKRVREAANIEVGDTLRWVYQSGKIIVVPPRRVCTPSEKLYGLIPSSRDAVKEIDLLRGKRVWESQP